MRPFLRRAFSLRTPIFPFVAGASCCALHSCALQDSLLEITLRSRVIEKLSVALHVCLFAPQGEREQHPENFQDEVRGEAISPTPLPKRVEEHLLFYHNRMYRSTVTE